MSFGFSVGDFIAITRIALELKSAYQSAPAEHEALAASLETFSVLIRGIQRDLEDRASRLGRASPQQLRQLGSILRHIQSVLNGLETIRAEYQDVDRRYRVWDRLRFPRQEVRFLQTQLQFHVMSLNLLLDSLGSEMMGKVLQLMEELAAENRLARANWGSLLRALRERGVTEADIAAHQADIEEIVHAADNVAQSERDLPADSSLRSSTGWSSAHSTTVFGDGVAMGDGDFPYVVGPPSREHLKSRVCEGALMLRDGRTGMKQKRRLPIFGSAKYRIECTKCKFVGFQDDKLDSFQAPDNTPLFFTTRSEKLLPSSLEYHILKAARQNDPVLEGLYYRTLFFWKCHVVASTETLHDSGRYECPFCKFSQSAGLFFGRLDLLEHILDQHVQRQPSLELRKTFNCWIGDTPFLFKDEYNRIQGRSFDIMLPRPFTEREKTLARIKRDKHL